MSTCSFKAGDRVEYHRLNFNGVRATGSLGTVTKVERHSVHVKWDDGHQHSSGHSPDYLRLAPPTTPKVGDTVRVVLEGPVTRVTSAYGTLDVGEVGYANVIHPAAEHVVSVEVIAPPVPRWCVGDVIVLRFRPGGTEYTYVRGYRDWPGDRERLSDFQVNEKFSRGLVRHVLRNGQPVTA